MTANTSDPYWVDSDGRHHYPACDGNRYCDSDPEDDRATESFACLNGDEPCPEPHVRPREGCWSEPVSTQAYLFAEHRAQMRLANAGRGLDEMVRLVHLGTMLQSSLDAARDEYAAAQAAVGAVHSTPIGLDPLPSPLHWDAMDVVAKRLYDRDAANAMPGWKPWGEIDEAARGSWRGEARALLAEATNAGKDEPC